MIAEETVRLAEGRGEVKSPAPIPIAVSARHVHLDRETMDLLFGAGSARSAGFTAGTPTWRSMRSNNGPEIFAR